MPQTRLRTRALIAAVLTVIAAGTVFLCVVARASAGTYTVYSCQTPAGVLAPTDGWSPESYGGMDFGSTTVNNCGTQGAAGNLGVSSCAHDASVDQSGNCYVWRTGWQGVLHYRAAPDTAFTKLTVWRSAWVTHNRHESASTSYWAGWLGIGSPERSDAIDVCGYESTVYNPDAEVTCHKGVGRGGHAIAEPNRVSFGSLDNAHDVYLVSACVGVDGSYPYCNPDGAVNLQDDSHERGGGVDYEVQSVQAELSDETAPTVQLPTGSLVDHFVLSGKQSVTYSATDTGSGLYRTLIDVKPANGQWKNASEEIVDENGGKCNELNFRTDDDHEFGFTQPCRLSATATAALDTSTLKDGTYDVRVLAEDASGNTTPVIDARTYKVANAPNTTSCANCASAAAVAPTAAPQPAVSAAAAAAPIVRFTADSRRTIDVKYGARRRVHGRLVDAAGHGVEDASVEVTDGHRHAIVKTRPDGTYAYRLRRGVSRSVTFGYRSAAGADYVDTAAVVVRVSGIIRLRSRRSSLPHDGVLRLDGKLLGAGRGAEIQVQAQDGSRWRTIDLLKTDGKGTIHYRYRFQRATGATFIFRLKMSAQPRVHLGAATSRPVTVRVR